MLYRLCFLSLWLQSIIRSYRQACALAVSKVKELSVSLEGKGEEEKRGLLVKCAATSLNSKLVRLLQLGQQQQQQQRAPACLQQVVTAYSSNSSHMIAQPSAPQQRVGSAIWQQHALLTCTVPIPPDRRCPVSVSSLPRWWLMLSQPWTCQHWTSR